MEILYADEKLVVCLKPRGVLSTDEPGGMPSLLRAQLGEGTSVYTVHRLDAAVGGVMVYARTRHAASDLGKAIQDGRFRKEYRAVITGRPPEPAGTLRDLLGRDPRRRMTFVANEPGPGVQAAELSYETLAERDGLTLLGIVLATGRTHQIRVQLASRGLPLWGDRKYGAGEGEHIALWSARIAFDHPRTGERMNFTAPPPAGAPWDAFMEEEYGLQRPQHHALLSGTGRKIPDAPPHPENGGREQG